MKSRLITTLLGGSAVAMLLLAPHAHATPPTVGTYVEEATGNTKQGNGVYVLGEGLVASDATPVTSAITSASASSSYTGYHAGRVFHAQLSGTAVATCYLERQLDGSTWTPITVSADGSTTTMYQWTYTGSTLSEDIVESQTAVPYRLDCGASLGSYTSGTLTVKFSQ